VPSASDSMVGRLARAERRGWMDLAAVAVCISTHVLVAAFDLVLSDGALGILGVVGATSAIRWAALHRLNGRT
jgi:hypothetical protein